VLNDDNMVPADNSGDKMSFVKSKMQLDLLLINPSLDWKLERARKISARVDKTIPNLESPHIGMTYLMAVANQMGIKAKYFDMAADGVSVEEIITDFPSKLNQVYAKLAFFPEDIEKTYDRSFDKFIEVHS